MRFAGPDVVLFAIGLALFSGSVYGLTQIEGGLGGGATSAFNAFTVTWTSSENATELATFGTDASAPFSFSIDEGAAVSKLVLTVDCAMAQPVPGTTIAIDVTISGPNGVNETGSGQCGAPVEIPITFDPDPKTGTYTGSNAADAESKAANAIGRNATGAWSGEVTFTSQSAAPVGLPIPVNYSGTVSVTTTSWTPKAAPVSSR